MTPIQQEAIARAKRGDWALADAIEVVARCESGPGDEDERRPICGVRIGGRLQASMYAPECADCGGSGECVAECFACKGAGKSKGGSTCTACAGEGVASEECDCCGGSGRDECSEDAVVLDLNGDALSAAIVARINGQHFIRPHVARDVIAGYYVQHKGP